MSGRKRTTRRALGIGLLLAVACACSDSASPPTAPVDGPGGTGSVLEFSLPESGTALEDPSPVSVSGAGIVEVRFSLDGELVAIDDEAPFTWTLDPSEISAGAHLLDVWVKTIVGEQARQAEIDVVPPAEPPTEPPPPPPGSGGIEFERATPEQIGIYVPIDADRFAVTPPDGAKAAVRYRESTASTWRDAHPLLRIHPEWNTIGAPVTPVDSFAGTIFGLEPGTAYVVEITVSAPGFDAVVLDGVQSTRTLPGATGDANKTATPSDDLQAIVKGLEPGDVLELGAGTYDVSPLQISVSGTASAPITIRGANRAQVVLSRSSGAVIQLTSASHLVLENFTIEGSGSDSGTSASSRGISFWDGAVQEYVTMRGLDIVGVDMGILASDTTRSILIYDCELRGNNEWNETFLHSNLTWNDDGIRIPGEGNCAFQNTLHGFGDSLAVIDGTFSAAVYFYRNRISMTGDDAWEADYGTRNIALYDNHISNCSTLMSCDPLWGGPAYCFRNIVVNTVRGPFKFNATQSGMLVYSNTIVRTDGTKSWGWVQPNNGALRNWSYRNNILVYQGGTSIAALESGVMDPIDFTHNGWYPDGSFWWSNSGGSATSLDAVRSKLPSTTPVFGTSTKRHDHDVILESQPFTATIPLGSDHLTEITTLFVPTLGSSSAAKAAGTAIPNVTDGYSGDAPDLGAVIGGRSNPAWGADR